MADVDVAAIRKALENAPDGEWRFKASTLEAVLDAYERAERRAWNEGARAATMDYGIGKAVNPYGAE